MFNELIVVAVTPFSGTSTPDKNGEYPVMLQCIAGKMPNRNVMSGTLAKRAGIEVDKTYLMQVREQGYDKVFGADFSFIKVKELINGSEIADVVLKLGTAEIFKVERPEGFESTYERKGDAIESGRTKRIREGDYVPLNHSTVANHKTAHVVKDGSTVRSTSSLHEEDLGKL